MPRNEKPHQVTKRHIGCELIYSKRFDVYWCMDCEEWAEPKCSDAECEYCTVRPERPHFSIE